MHEDNLDIYKFAIIVYNIRNVELMVMALFKKENEQSYDLNIKKRGTESN